MKDGLFPVQVTDVPSDNSWRGAIGDTLWVKPDTSRRYYHVPKQQNYDVFVKLDKTLWNGMLQLSYARMNKDYAVRIDMDNEFYYESLPNFSDL